MKSLKYIQELSYKNRIKAITILLFLTLAFALFTLLFFFVRQDFYKDFILTEIEKKPA
ncbi:hypothetical protein LEP1GSC038_4313 [Leptospira weilii str. 2006001855]|uniref:Uncharacterized protein n=1 Tax=Leptospira weilii str. 2006001855 TaxID=996804 RepID=M6FYY7_9LEPT|nr:hypothetical protein LEP1GSC038_4313 [Leptospira weilii str. 2006001855]